MNERTKQTSSKGCGVLAVLQIIFIVLKCLGLISWSWPVVLIPLWIELGLIVVLAIILLIVYAVAKKQYKE